MTSFRKVNHFVMNKNSGAHEYDLDICRALTNQSHNYIYSYNDIKNLKIRPRFLALIFFWCRSQLSLFFGNIDVAILSPWMMFIFPKKISIIAISHHYDPSCFKGLRSLYIKFAHWFFIFQRNRVSLVVSCSKYWSHFYKKKGFKNTITIHNGFDIEAMDGALGAQSTSKVLKKYNLSSKKYIHLGSYGTAKGQKVAYKSLKGLGFKMIATTGSKVNLKSTPKGFKLINASYSEYNILLKNAIAVVCMSEFKEGWCRVLHEGAIHGTAILGSGLGGMNELLKVGSLSSSKSSTLLTDLKKRVKNEYQLNKLKKLYRSFTLNKFYKAWIKCIDDVIVD